MSLDDNLKISQTALLIKLHNIARTEFGVELLSEYNMIGKRNVVDRSKETILALY